ncbi:MAG: nucleoside deaminase [Bacteroidales bacterium]|nr:nucleoside deaminase [Bacteroidales bacterium]MDD2424901.1 nucleoside deaminase [Bacteroidales bacterium]MDD3989715.1 nucleoside deaminase [Bacteroidales bacterium]MDD4638594.1 nucleoside deaminase [Bacteroidales bacterium]
MKKSADNKKIANSKGEEIYLRDAIALAEKNASGTQGGPFGAVIVSGDRIIARGVNTVTSENDPTAHAEVNAIREACKKLNSFTLKECTLYTSCEPCPMCLSAAYWAGIGRIYYAASREDAHNAGFSDSFIYDQICLLPGERDVEMEQLLEEEGRKPFEEWQANNRRVEY